MLLSPYVRSVVLENSMRNSFAVENIDSKQTPPGNGVGNQGIHTASDPSENRSMKVHAI